MFKEIHFPKIASTHLYALDHIKEHAGEFVFISAEDQTGGIGRKGDPWLSTGDNLLGTFIFPLPEKSSSNLAQLLAYSIIKILEKLAVAPSFKWPNDILIAHKKVAGVMADIKENAAIVSMGMNVNMQKTDLDKVDVPATSLSEELLHHLSVHSLKKDLLHQFFSDLTIFQAKGFDPFFTPFAAKLAFVGKLAKSGAAMGRIAGLNPDGRLILDANGTPILLSTSSLEIIE